MSMNGDYLTMAEAAGECEPRPLSWSAAECEGWHDDDYEAAGLAMERDMYARAERERERAYWDGYEAGRRAAEGIDHG